MSKDSGNFNFNSVLLMIVLALSGWTLKTVTDQEIPCPPSRVQVQNLERVVYRSSGATLSCAPSAQQLFGRWFRWLRGW